MTVRKGRGWKEAKRTGKPVESNYIIECPDCPILPYGYIAVASFNKDFVSNVSNEHLFEHAKNFVYFMTELTGAWNGH